jgi:polar amino acid transport system substrate-binding protein
MRIFLLVLVLLIPLTTTAQTPLRFARNENFPEQDVAEAVFRHVMHNLQVDVLVDPLPPARANLLNLTGVVVGEVGRIENYGVKNPALIRVEPGHYYLTTVVFARKDHGIKISGPADLAQYKVAHVRGVQHSADFTKDLPFVRESNNSESLFNLLEAERVDLIITTGVDGQRMLRQMGLTDQIEAVAELARRDLFVYLGPSYAQWKDPISKELARMAASGEMAKVIAEAEQQLIDAAPSGVQTGK